MLGTKSAASEKVTGKESENCEGRGGIYNEKEKINDGREKSKEKNIKEHLGSTVAKNLKIYELEDNQPKDRRN